MSHASIQSMGRRDNMRGQSMVEFLIAAPILFFLILVLIQFVILYRIKATLDYAALEAARAGAVSGISKFEMKDALAQGMTPLYINEKGPGHLHTAYLKALADMGVFSRIEVINPTRAAWDEYKEKQYNNKKALPNDSLAFRSDSVGSSGVNVQDANILKIKVTYYAPIVVPFVKLVFRNNSEYLKADMLESAPVNLTGRLPIESYAIVRMQSPVFERNRLDN